MAHTYCALDFLHPSLSLSPGAWQVPWGSDFAEAPGESESAAGPPSWC